ncbi:MAG TPA: protein kinase [Pyrinomonadaceae bacterium]|nr:protein kinase [Pyrinomonadaceae bacterium]
MLSLQDPYHLVGCTILDKYRIDALVGIGGMGAVYGAHHLTINRRVAFKILLPNLALAHEKLLSLFQREAEMAGQLNHENIVDIKDAGLASEGIAYIVMEWLEGRTLEDEIHQTPFPSLDRVARILRQIAAALDHAHARHIIHRDLKPSNVMLVKQADGCEQVKVLDFGLAKVVSESTKSPVSSLIGTPHYASPEQFVLGGHIDKRSDIYSLGVLLYQMLSGYLPFDAPTVHELIRLQRTQQPPPIHQYRGDIPVVIEQLLLQMLAKDPDQRPQSATEAADIFVRAAGAGGSKTGDRLATSAQSALPTVIATPTGTEFSNKENTAKERSAVTGEPRPSKTDPNSAATTSPQMSHRGEKEKGEEVIRVSLLGKQNLKKYLIPVALALTVITSLLVLLPRLPRLFRTPGPTPAETIRSELMSYYLETSSDDCLTFTRETGDVSLSANQVFRFHFKPQQDGYLYLIAQNERNVPTTLLTAQPDPETGVKTNFVRAEDDFSFPSSPGNCIGITANEQMMAFTVIFSRTLLATPAFLASPARRELTATEQHQLNLWRQQHETAPPLIAPDTKLQLSHISIVRESAIGDKPVIFDLPVKHR